MTLERCIFLAIALFAIGCYGVLTRRHLIGMLLSIELMLNAANISFVAFAHFKATDPLTGGIFPIFAMAVAACEMAVALAIVIAMYHKKKHMDVSRLEELHG